jgi:hypothetical protein
MNDQATANAKKSVEPRRSLSLKHRLGGTLGTVRSVAEVATGRAAVPYAAVDGAVRDQLWRELHVYPRKKLWIARVLWLVVGVVGAHRYYMGQTLRGAAMTLTAGGVFIWWIVDGFRLRGMVEQYNEAQAEREAADEPPLGMEFVPNVAPDTLGKMPAWHQVRRYSRFGRVLRRGVGLLADGAMLTLAAYMLGQLALEAGVLNPVYAAVAVVLMINGAPLMMAARHWPVARDMIRWDLRLRLFYHFNKPGHAGRLFGRLVLGLFYAPFLRKARTEVKLYLEVAGIFVAGSAVLYLFTGQAWQALSGFEFETLFSSFAENWFRNAIVGFVMVYGFTAVIGATLMKHMLLRRPHWVLWSLSLLTFFFLLSGLELF